MGEIKRIDDKRGVIGKKKKQNKNPYTKLKEGEEWEGCENEQTWTKLKAIIRKMSTYRLNWKQLWEECVISKNK